MWIINSSMIISNHSFILHIVINALIPSLIEYTWTNEVYRVSSWIDLKSVGLKLTYHDVATIMTILLSLYARLSSDWCEVHLAWDRPKTWPQALQWCDQFAIQREYPYCYNCLWSSIISQMFLFDMDSCHSLYILYIKKYHLAYPSQLEE